MRVKLTICVPGVMSRGNDEKRVPCPPSAAAPADYKRDEDVEGDDSPGLIVACNF